MPTYDKEYTLSKISSTYVVPREVKFIETESGMVVLGGEGKMGIFFLMGTVSVWEDEKVLKVDGSDGSTAVLMHLMPLNCVICIILNKKIHS